MSNTEIDLNKIVPSSEAKTSKRSKSESKAKPKASKNAKKNTSQKSNKTKQVKVEQEKVIKIRNVHKDDMLKKFSPHTIQQFLNNYYSNVIPQCKISFTKYDETKKNNVIDLHKYNEIENLRDYINSITNGVEFTRLSKKTYSPYLHTALSFIESCDNKINEHIKELVNYFGIEFSNEFDYEKTIHDIVSYINDTTNFTTKFFNNAFSSYYTKLHPDKKEVHKRYLQHSSEFINTVLSSKNDKFDVSTTTILTNVMKSCSVISTADKKKILTMVVKKEELEKSASIEFKHVYDEINNVINFVENKLSEIDNEDEYKTMYNNYMTAYNDYETRKADVMKQISKFDIKKIDNKNGFKLLMYVLVKMSKCFDNGFNNLISNLKKNGVVINIKSGDFKKAILALAENKTFEKNLNDVCDKYYDDVIKTINSDKIFDPYNTDIYDKFGFHYYLNNSEDTCVGLPRNIRIAIGLTLFKHIDDEVKCIVQSKQKVSNFNISIKF